MESQDILNPWFPSELRNDGSPWTVWTVWRSDPGQSPDSGGFSVLADEWIGREQGELLEERGGNEKAIKGIAMQQGQCNRGEGLVSREGEHSETVSAAGSGEPFAGSEWEIKFPCCVLLADFESCYGGNMQPPRMSPQRISRSFT